MVDACIKNNLPFLHNIKQLIQHEGCYIDKIFITHSHFDHYQGSYDVIQLCKELTGIEPKVYKYRCPDLEMEKSRLIEHPELENHLYHTNEGDSFTIVDETGASKPISFKPIETPGHLKDHLCFLIQQEGEEEILFTGDHIIGAKSTFFTDYPEYLRSLQKVKRMTNVKKFLMAHSVSLNISDILVDAAPKVEEYIQDREKKDHEMLQAALGLKKFSISELYFKLYEEKKKPSKIQQGYMERILTRRIQKLLQEKVVQEDGRGGYVVTKL